MTIASPNTTLLLYDGPRANIIGASDAASLLGCSGFVTQTGAILRKRGLAVESKPNARTDGGNWMEPLLRQAAARAFATPDGEPEVCAGIPFHGPMIAGPQPHMAFHPDGWLYFPNPSGAPYFVLLEIKVAMHGDDWSGDMDEIMEVTPENCPIPASYVQQICWQLACLEGTSIDQAICVGFRAQGKLTCTFYVFDRPVWAEYIARVVAGVDAIVQRYLVPAGFQDACDQNGELQCDEAGNVIQVPLYEDPTIDGSAECRQWLVGLWASPWKPLRRGDEAEHKLAVEYDRVRSAEKEAKERKELIANQLLMKFGEDEGFSGRFGGVFVKAKRDKGGALRVTVGE